MSQAHQDFAQDWPPIVYFLGPGTAGTMPDMERWKLRRSPLALEGGRRPLAAFRPHEQIRTGILSYCGTSDLYARQG